MLYHATLAATAAALLVQLVRELQANAEDHRAAAKRLTNI